MDLLASFAVQTPKAAYLFLGQSGHFSIEFQCPLLGLSGHRPQGVITPSKFHCKSARVVTRQLGQTNFGVQSVSLSRYDTLRREAIFEERARWRCWITQAGVGG